MKGQDSGMINVSPKGKRLARMAGLCKKGKLGQEIPRLVPAEEKGVYAQDWLTVHPLWYGNRHLS